LLLRIKLGFCPQKVISFNEVPGKFNSIKYFLIEGIFSNPEKWALDSSH